MRMRTYSQTLLPPIHRLVTYKKYLNYVLYSINLMQQLNYCSKFLSCKLILLNTKISKLLIKSLLFIVINAEVLDFNVLTTYVDSAELNNRRRYSNLCYILIYLSSYADHTIVEYIEYYLEIHYLLLLSILIVKEVASYFLSLYIDLGLCLIVHDFKILYFYLYDYETSLLHAGFICHNM